MTEPISIAKKFPGDNERVLIFDALHREWHVGWNAYRHMIGGQSRPGTWILPIGYADDMHITHWAPFPPDPDA
jgi:hypothetical protein